jgi:hypothetical protein
MYPLERERKSVKLVKHIYGMIWGKKTSDYHAIQVNNTHEKEMTSNLICSTNRKPQTKLRPIKLL